MRNRFAALFLGLALVVGGWEQAALAQTAPAQSTRVQSAKELDIPYERFVLDNGLTVIVHEDHKAPIVAINTWYHVGSKNEKIGKTGFAHLFEHLMFGGSEHAKGRYIDAMESFVRWRRIKSDCCRPEGYRCLATSRSVCRRLPLGALSLGLSLVQNLLPSKCRSVSPAKPRAAADHGARCRRSRYRSGNRRATLTPLLPVKVCSSRSRGLSLKRDHVVGPGSALR